jgi:Leucine-rich repeat (LRR) protein
LVLSNNMLTSLPAGVFDSLMELEHLYLDNNVLSSLPAGIFDALTKLQVLCTVMMKPLE